jgi:uncharacterized membrane protein YdbT with pleckstrin-like domain
MHDLETVPPPDPGHSVPAVGAPAVPGQTLPATLRPERTLLVYYALVSLLFGPFFWIALLPMYFRYRTLRYELDDEGISMRWGILFRREVSLTYARIQDIHLNSNVVERWLDLARVQVQTASGSASAEMKIEGLRQVEALRDFLYRRMRGAHGDSPESPRGDSGESPAEDPLTATLREVALELRALRESLPRAVGGGDRG